MLNGFIKYLLSALMPTFALKVRRKIATSSSEASTATPFTFGSRLKRREGIDRLRRTHITNDVVRDERLDALDRVSVCTFGRLRQSIVGPVT